MPSLPSSLNLKDLQRREQKAFDDDAKWHDLLDDAYEYFLPNRDLFDNNAPGQKKMDRIFDSTALQAIQNGASKLQENIAPIWARWANLEPSEEVLAKLDNNPEFSETQIRENLENQASIMFDHINRSNFATQFFEHALDLLIGTGTLRVDEDPDNDETPLVFTAVPQKGLAFEEGPLGTIETHWRRLEVKAVDLERKYPGFEASAAMSAKISDDPQSKVSLCEGVVFVPSERNYYGVVWVKGEERVSWVEDYQDSSPWNTARYSKTSGEVRGRGPAVQSLPDVRTLNKVQEYALSKAAIDLAGIYTGTDDGVFNPYNLTIAPGVVIPVGSNNNQNPTLQRLDTTQPLQLTLFELESLRNNVKLAFFDDLRDPTSPVRSATEIALDARELAKRIGSAFGRLQTELLIPVLRRVHWILKRRGVLQDFKVGGEEVAVKFTSPLAKAQDSEDLLSVQQAVEFTMATGGPEAVQVAYKVESFGTWAAEKTGMPQELVRSESEKAEVAQAGALAEAQGVQDAQ